jgi:nucleoid-associated protein YgaU
MIQRVSTHYVVALPTALDPITVMRDQSQQGRRVQSNAADYQSLYGGAAIATIPWVTSAQWRPRIPLVHSFTYDDSVIQRGTKGIRAWDIVLSGKASPLPFRKYATNETVISPSWEHLERLRLLLETAVRDYGYCHLYALDEGWSWKVMPTGGPDYVRGQGDKLGALWTISFEAVAPLDPPAVLKIEPLIDEDIKSDPPAVAAKAAEKTKFSLLRAAAAARAAMQKAIGVVTGPIHAALNYVDGVVSEIEAFEALIVSVAHMPERMVTRALSLYSRTRNAVIGVYRGTYKYARDRWFGFKRFDSGGSALAGMDELASLVREQKEEQRTAEYEMMRSALSVRMAAMRTGNAKIHSIGARDSLASIAASTLGDPSLWKTLADENDLRYPFISAAGAPGTVKPGDTIRVPDTDAGASASVAHPDESDDERVFGTDFAMDSDYDIAFTEYADGADWDLAVGVPCIEQSVHARMRWERGENRLFPTRGVAPQIGAAMAQDSAVTFAIAMATEMRADDRVARVENARTVDAGNGLRWEGTVVLVNSQGIPIGDAR